MRTLSIQLKSILSVLLLVSIVGCDDVETFAPIGINFTFTELGISSSISTVNVSLTFSRAVEENGTLTLNVATSPLTYGENADYYTIPALIDNQIIVPFSAGDESISFSVLKGENLNIQEDKKLIISTLDKNENLALGLNHTVEITFSENFIAQNGIVELDAGGAEFPKQSFFDFSKLNQTVVDKYSWDLGFYNETGAHRVTLNNGAYVMARAIEKFNLNEVTAADTIGFSSAMIVSNYYEEAASLWIDDQSGDLAKTAIGIISANDIDNKVFIIKRDGARNWKKIRILQNGDGYTIQYADISATTYTSTNISKNEANLFSSFDLDEGLQKVAPDKNDWDIMYGCYAGRANYGIFLAVGYNDYVILNRQASALQISDMNYDEFSTADLTGITLVEDNISVIGSSWRTLVDYTLQLKPDVFYVIRDANKNVYKMKFNRLKSTNEERGYPEIAFELLK